MIKGFLVFIAYYDFYFNFTFRIVLAMNHQTKTIIDKEIPIMITLVG